MKGMTATRELSWTVNQVEGSVDASIELLDDEAVYFTDQEPRFQILVENNTNYDFDDNSGFRWEIAIGEGRPEPFIGGYVPLAGLPAGEEFGFEISDEPLSLEGHGIVAIGIGRIRHVNTDSETVRFKANESGKENYEPLATFSVWDREHYEVVHEQPQRTQHFALFASMGIVFFAILQAGEIIGYPTVGLLGGIVLLALYWYSGFLGDFIEALQERRRTTN